MSPTHAGWVLTVPLSPWAPATLHPTPVTATVYGVRSPDLTLSSLVDNSVLDIYAASLSYSIETLPLPHMLRSALSVLMPVACCFDPKGFIVGFISYALIITIFSFA